MRKLYTLLAASVFVLFSSGVAAQALSRKLHSYRRSASEETERRDRFSEPTNTSLRPLIARWGSEKNKTISRTVRSSSLRWRCSARSC